MKKLLILNFIFSLKIFCGITGVLEGFIRDSKSKEAIVGATILIEGTKLGATTNSKGYFLIQNISIGTYSVKFTMMSYAPIVMKDVKIYPDFSTKLSIELSESAIEVEPVIIRAEQDLIQRDQAGTIFHIGSQKIEMLPLTKFSEIISYQPGTTIEGNIRGGKVNDALYLIDGVGARDMLSGGVNLQLPKYAITGVSIFTGGFDAEFGNALSGVVNIITKSGTTDHTISAQVESDSWIPTKINKQQNKFISFETAFSGPIISDQLSYFSSHNFSFNDTRYWQDFENTFSSPIEKEGSGIFKLDYTPSILKKFSIQTIYSFKNWRDYEFSWRYNLDGLPTRSNNSIRTLMTYTRTLSMESFFTVSFVSRFQNSKIGEGEKKDIVAQPYEYDFFLRYIIDGNRAWWAETNQITNSIKGDFTSRINEKHFLKTGGEINFYNVKSDLIKYEPQKTYFGKPITSLALLNFSNSFKYSPRAGNIFIQDKIEVKNGGANINFGLRWDFFDPRAERPIVEFIPIEGKDFETKITGTKKADFTHQISPRFSIAAPIGGDNFLFVNFGHYFQIPLFDYLYSGITPAQIRFGSKNVQAGNPELKPERTILWEIGVKRELFFNTVGSVTYFKKRMIDQIDSKTLIPFDSKYGGDFGFATYVNNSEANANGFEILFHREKDGGVNGNLSYTFMITEGLSEYVDQTLNYAQWGFPLVTRPYPLSWDQRHAIKSDIEFILPFDISSNLILLYNSPRPYTFYPTRDGFLPRDSGKVFLPNNMRMENVVFINLKMVKKFSFLKLLIKDGELYFDIHNLLNRKNIRWIDSNGRIGGELGDPSAYYSPRRINFGFRCEW